ncbi:uncharacterized protein LOC125208918 isoform X1 [Salvia hispanica]|uniref:uncharacterized protein LOC125208918 isoform X1 n=1 Tax=Salvia hispanica TaxID=49212 RepID=UPI002009954C|nr:uncharacterized protein LOC125208918 isoform X1 [Salvia hispanica]
MAARRLGRFATSATRCLPLCNSVRSTNSFSGNAETTSARGNKLYTPFANPTNQSTGIASCVSETNCQSFSPFSQLWKANKPHIYYVYCRDKVLGSYFAAYSLEEDCTINTMPPKYYKCLPSFLVNDYGFTGASSNGLFLFHSIKLGYVLWNPTMSEYN